MTQLTRLTIEHFRRVSAATLEFAPGSNLLIGENAQGKTTVLEAVCYTARGRSFRTRRDRDCLQRGEQASELSSIEAVYTTQSGERTVRVALTSQGKSIFLDGKPVRRLAELIGLFPVVTFTPEDLALIRSGPAERRSFIDGLIAADSPLVLQALLDYASALRERNTLLRGQSATAQELEAWEDQLAQAGARIVLARRQLVADLAPSLERHLGRLAPGDLPVSATIEHDFSAEATDRESLADELRVLWQRDRRRDQDRGSTNAGPHRSDLVLTIAGQDSRQFASQGQARSLALALRLAERELLQQRLGVAPILLLDDVLGELDKRRTAHFVSILSEAETQSILTATDAAALEASLPILARFAVSGGVITPNHQG